MGQSNSTQSRSSRRQQQASASTRTRSLRPLSSATPRPAASSPPSPPSVAPNNINGRSNSQNNNASPAHTSGTMALTPTPTTPQQGYSHSLLHQHQHQHQHAIRVNSSHHLNHMHSTHSTHSTHSNHSTHSTHSHHHYHHQTYPHTQQQQQRPLGTSSTLPACPTSPVWHNTHHPPSSVPRPVTTSTPSTGTSAAPASSSATAPSRVLRSTTRRRRLLSAFYPLLSRNSSNRGDATVPSSPGSAEPTTSHTQSQGQSLGQSNRLNNNNGSNINSSTMTANATPETRPPRHRQPERPLSRNGLQSASTPSAGRSSRGRSRVQRRYDEQSIRSLRSSSSRSSSVLTSPPPAAYTTGASAAASMSAAAPSMVPPSSMMSMHAPIYQLSATPQTEPMELDHGVPAPTPYSHHYHQQQHLSQHQHMSLNSQGVPAHFMPVDHATSSSRMTLASSRTDDSVFSGRSSATGAPAETSQGSRPEASHISSSSRPDPSHVRFGGLFVGLSNPRGGTSISSSLLPIRPDSEDEDEYGHTAEDDRSQRRASSLYHHLDLASTATDADQQQNQQGAGPRVSTGDSRRPRPPRTNRYPPPDIVADLIQEQIEQALAESAAAAHASTTLTATPTTSSFSTSTVLSSSTESAPSWTQSTQQQQHQQQRTIPSEHMATLPRHNSSSTSLETVNNSTAAGESHRDGSTSAGSSTSETPSDSVLGEDLFGRRSTRVHRRRLRSSSLRGLLGFQPMSSVMTEERLTGTSHIEGDSLPEQQSRSSHGSDGNMERPRLAEMRFFARLMSEIGRGLRGHSAQNSESGGDRMPTGSTTASTPPIEFATDPSLASIGATHVGMTDLSGSETNTTTAAPLATAMEAAPMPDATSTSMDESTTEPSPPVRPRRHTTIRFIQIGENGRVDIGSGRRSRSRSTGTGQGSLRSDSPEGSGREDHLADAIIMLLSNSSPAAGQEGETSDNALDDPDGSRPGRHRRSPWLVLTLSGAFIGSLLAGSGAEGEDGGMSYDDLWALSNLIGPARPTTTTQEAIDNAGFHVGQFDDATKGMRGFPTLGDGSKCLVCMSDYEEGEDMRALTCKHGFHQECIDKWLTTGANKCPVCRAAAVVSSEPVVAGAPLGSEE
ncbi:hypothetical protein BGZ95_011854 [Linnemannia exigua]|uniref:RING-type domain-containing protein n=1 Tax=Linnemannia exigua TaxID=604196 RepID=A0AAD4DBF3_9FUNG|nr:hypothetical protein BGZ95_011854 [Linnemannia exigua]